MFDQQSAFFRRSKDIAEKFLQTTVIIDDQVKFRDKLSPGDFQQKNTDDPKVDGKSELQSEMSIKGPREPREPLKIPESERKGYKHDLYAEEVINSFARKKIVCSVINPTLAPDLTDTFKNLATSADIIVVDWDLKLEEKNGETALDILAHVSLAAIETPAQLRLFAIYTGDPDIGGIAETVKSTLKERLGDALKVEDNNCTLTFKSIRVVVVAKPYTTGIQDLYQDRKVSFDTLAERVIIEFTRMTAGLVSNVAVEALTCLRRNTFRILERFAQELDAPYLTHRLLQPTPLDVEDHLISLISEEFYAILDEAHIGSEAGIKAIEDWLIWRNLSELKPTPKSDQKEQKSKSYNRDEILDLFRLGARKLEKDKCSAKSVSKSTTEQLATSPEAANGLDEKFAMLMCLRSFYEDTTRVLSLGTILRKQRPGDKIDDYEYLLCIQPVCDSVRLESSRAFPFIPLSITESKFNTIIYDGIQKRYIRLMPSTKVYEMKLIWFKPADGYDHIESLQDNGNYIFNDIEGFQYHWVSELRGEHAMRLVQNFASSMSRVGLNESEWLRLSGT